MGQKSDANLVGTRALAEAFGLTTRRVQQLVEEGVLENLGTGRNKRFNWIDSVQRYLAHLSEKNSDYESQEAAVSARKAQAEADLKRTRADEAAIKLAELECRMHRSDDVETVMGNLVFFVRQALVSMPGRISVDVANAKSASEVSAIVKREIDSVLTSLGGFGYNKADFAKLVRERVGWETDGEESGSADS